MQENHNRINLTDTIDSGQVFLWNKINRDEQNHITQWYGINGQKIQRVQIKTDHDNNNNNVYENEIIVKTYSNDRWCNDTCDFFRNKDNVQNNVIKSLSNDNTIKTAIARYPGLRIMRQDPYQCMISFIVSANSNIQKIRSNLTKLTQKFGNVKTVKGIGKIHLFPTADIITKASIKEIQECGVGYRAKYVIEASKMITTKEINYKDIIQMENYHDAVNVMCKIPGVGNKVADCILLFALERLDAFPLDRWMIRVLDKYYRNILNTTHLSTSLTDRRYKTAHDKIVRYFGPYAGYAQQWLFKMARDDAKVAWLQKNP